MVLAQASRPGAPAGGSRVAAHMRPGGRRPGILPESAERHAVNCQDEPTAAASDGSPAHGKSIRAPLACRLRQRQLTGPPRTAL